MDAMQGLRMVAQLVECLLSMHKALSSVTITAGNWASWSTPVVPTVRRWRQRFKVTFGFSEFGSNLSFVRPHLKA